MQRGETAGHKSRDRPPVIHHVSETKQERDERVLDKVGKIEAV